TYIGLAASQFQPKASLVSVVGADFPQEYLQLLKNKNLDISAIEIVSDGKTFFWSGKYHNDLNTRDTIETQLNVLSDFKPVVPKSFRDAEILMLGNLHPAVQMSVIHQMEIKP